MKNYFILFLFTITIVSNSISLIAQNCSLLPNPSFEGVKGAGIVPSSCNLCKNTPDTEPSFSTIIPSEGSTCLGLFGELGTYSESASQKFSSPLVNGQAYSFTIDLCYAQSYYYNCTGAGVYIYLGNSTCGTNQLIYTSGQITNTSWKTFTVNFTPNSNYTYILFQTQNITNGYENVLIDNIIFDSALEIELNTTDAVCNNDNGFVIASVTGGTVPYTYAWTNGKTTSSINGLAAGSYGVTVTDAQGCTTTATTILNNTNAPSLSLIVTDASYGNNNGTATVIADNGTSPYSYSWSNGDTTNSIIGLAAGIYIITVTDSNGCQTTDSAIIKSDIPYENFSLGNTFTPNGDGVNDYFMIPNAGLENFGIKIYNRWGHLMFETTDPTEYWNGKTKSNLDASSGVYFYIIKANSYLNDYSCNGILTLIRE